MAVFHTLEDLSKCRKPIAVDPKGAVFISRKTSRAFWDLYSFIGHHPEEVHDWRIACLLLNLDTLIQGIFCFDRLYAVEPLLGEEPKDEIKQNQAIPEESYPLDPYLGLNPPDKSVIHVVAPTRFPLSQLSFLQLRNRLLKVPVFRHLVASPNAQIWTNLARASGSSVGKHQREKDRRTFCTLDVIESVEDISTATQLDIPLLSDPITTSVCLSSHLSSEKLSKKVASEFMAESLEDLWRELAEAGNELKGEGFFSADAPLFLLAVLKECRRWSEIPSVSMKMRDEEDIRELRQWLRQVDEEKNLSQVLLHRREVLTFMDHLRSRYHGSTRGEFAKRLSIGIFPPGISISGEQGVEMLSSARKRHLRFLNRVIQTVSSGTAFEEELHRLLLLSTGRSRRIATLLSKVSERRA